MKLNHVCCWCTQCDGKVQEKNIRKMDAKNEKNHAGGIILNASEELNLMIIYMIVVYFVSLNKLITIDMLNLSFLKITLR